MKFDPYPIKDVGGLAAQSTLINIVRAEVDKSRGSVLVLSTGDVNTGIPESDLQDAEPDFMAMNMIGYDAMVLGNHEFDNSIAVLKKQQRWAAFAFLSANVFYKGTSKPLVDPYVIKQFDELTIAVLGVTTQQVPRLTNSESVKELDFMDPIAAARKWCPG